MDDLDFAGKSGGIGGRHFTKKRHHYLRAHERLGS